MDILSIVPAVLITLSAYRIKRAIEEIKGCTKRKHVHLVIWKSGLLVLYDATGLIALLPLAVTVLPLYALWALFRANADRLFEWKNLRYYSLLLCLGLPFAVRTSELKLCYPLSHTRREQFLSVLLLPIHGFISFLLLDRNRPPFLVHHLTNRSILLLRAVRDAKTVGSWHWIWLAVLTQLLLLVLTLVSHVFAGFSTCTSLLESAELMFSFAPDFVAVSILALGAHWWPFEPCGNKKYLIIPLWLVTLPLFGLLQFVIIQLPRVLSAPALFSSTIFNLCSVQARRLEGCQDFYSASVYPGAPWGWIWTFWCFFYLYSLIFLGKWIKEHILGSPPAATPS